MEQLKIFTYFNGGMLVKKINKPNKNSYASRSEPKMTEKQFVENWGERPNSGKELTRMLYKNEKHLDMLISLSDTKKVARRL